ncbi:lectin, mannose-binding, 1-like protein [Camelus ferus]|nr:lectin, mannose-binding, 1-like protein [Camelus ferus]
MKGRGPVTGEGLSWSTDAIPGLEEVRLAPSMRNRSGAVWSRTPVLFSAWEVDMQMRVTGPGRRGAQGMAVWYTQGRGQVGSVLGALASGDGIGILFDSLAEDVQNSPAIRVLAGDGHTLYEPLGDGGSRVLGSCHRDFRNRPYPFRARITYWGQRLRVSFNSGLTPSDPDEVCVDVGPLLLAPGGFFGVSAATSTLADDHDVLSFLTFSLSEPGPEISHGFEARVFLFLQPPLQPFLEAEHLRLARQLKGLQARLALGTKEDMIPKLNSEVQEEGRDPESKQDSAKVSALLHGQRTLLQDLQEMRHAAAHMASRAQVFYLPVGTKHHFLELAQTLSLLQKDLRAPAPGFFLFILLIQTVGFFCYVHFSVKLFGQLLGQWVEKPKTMAFMVKTMVGGQLKNLTGSLGGGEDKGDGDKSAAEAQGMSREEYEEYQKQLVEEKMERDAQFTQRKAERATLRSHFRDKYRLPKNETDESQIQMAGGDVELPRELAKMIEEDTEEEEERASVLGQLASLPGLDLGSLKDKAQTTLGDLKQSAEKCHIM